MLEFNSRISKEEYLDKVVAIKNHIQEGNIYELNFCQEYFADNVEIKDSIETYFKLNTITKAPYSAFLQVDDFSVFCGSPERFLKKTERTLISQPIKGTAPRGFTAEKDEQLRSALADDPKERAENIMIVDLVRNDLSRLAAKNSVKVDELCKIYSFETVHQMISTISCEIEQDVNFTDILKATFPMGSMTGAPKLRSMELIESFESFKRGLYSGSLGYIAPNGDFDFNVIIRAVLYNQKSRYLSCAVGSAITIKSDPEMEYEECMVKVKRIMDGING
jgi:para-aminobenzoate synthetase component 1